MHSKVVTLGSCNKGDFFFNLRAATVNSRAPYFHLLLENFQACSTFVGDEAEVGNNSAWNMDCSTVVRIKTLHISSPILAAKSPFFYKVKITIIMEVDLILSLA